MTPEQQDRVLALAMQRAPTAVQMAQRYPLLLMGFTDPYILNQLEELWEATASCTDAALREEHVALHIALLVVSAQLKAGVFCKRRDG